MNKTCFFIVKRAASHRKSVALARKPELLRALVALAGRIGG
jgi:hypothetical protein